MELELILVLCLIGAFLALLFSGYPIAFILGGIGVATTAIATLLIHAGHTEISLSFRTLGLVVPRVFNLMDNQLLVALPMFVFMGLMLERSGVARKMMAHMQALLGGIRGGLAISVTIIGVLLAASTGIIGASVVLLGMLSLPAMLRQKYQPELAVGVICASGTLGILIPPSIMLVIMADQLGVNVGDLFVGAVIPGLILAGLYLGYVLIVGLLKPHAAPAPENREPLTRGLVFSLLVSLFPPLMLILLVLGSIFFGWATPTEASGVGAMGATLLALVSRKLTIKTLHEVGLDTLKTSAFIFAIIAGATCFSLVLRQLGGDQMLEAALTRLPFPPGVTVAIILGFVFLLGFVLDWIEITMIILPLVGPIIAKFALNVNGYGGKVEQPILVWFGILVAMALQTSFLTPPVGFALFYLKGVCPKEITMKQLCRGVVPFIVLQLVGLALVAIWPDIVTWLPSHAAGP